MSRLSFRVSPGFNGARPRRFRICAPCQRAFYVAATAIAACLGALAAILAILWFFGTLAIGLAQFLAHTP